MRRQLGQKGERQVNRNPKANSEAERSLDGQEPDNGNNNNGNNNSNKRRAREKLKKSESSNNSGVNLVFGKSGNRGKTRSGGQGYDIPAWQGYTRDLCLGALISAGYVPWLLDRLTRRSSSRNKVFYIVLPVTAKNAQVARVLQVRWWSVWTRFGPVTFRSTDHCPGKLGSSCSKFLKFPAKR